MPAGPVIGTREAVKEALRTKSGLVGTAMLILLMVVVVAVPIIAPYDVVRAWGSVSAWTDNPRNAAPEWIDMFTDQKLARNIIINQEDFGFGQSNTSTALTTIFLRARWQFDFDQFPSDIVMQLEYNWSGRPPITEVVWRRPDGESFTIYSSTPTRKIEIIQFSASGDLQNRVRSWAVGLGAEPVEIIRPHVTLYAVQGPGMMNLGQAQTLKGSYSLEVTTFAFDPADQMAARLLNYGQVYGFAGTDSLRRDLLIGLLWGAPVALAFGAAAALITVTSQVILGALGAYYGGRFDELVQRSADFFLIIPILPILILIGAFYTPSILFILFIIVAFSIVGGTTKVVRSIALQVKEELHIESARSYGAPRRRILFRYIMPRTMPYTFALLALSVPSFIFLEAALSFLGLGDPILPTWGALLGDAYRNGALYNGLWWWIAFPAVGILFATVAFAILGYAFDKVLNPRLREE